MKFNTTSRGQSIDTPWQQNLVAIAIVGLVATIAVPARVSAQRFTAVRVEETDSRVVASHLGFHDHDKAIRADAGVAIENFAREGGKTGGKVARAGQRANHSPARGI